MVLRVLGSPDDGGCKTVTGTDGGDGGGSEEQQQPPDSTVSQPEQPPPASAPVASEADGNDVTVSEENKTRELSESEKPSPLQEKIIRQIEVRSLSHHIRHLITSLLHHYDIMWYTWYDIHTVVYNFSSILETEISRKISFSNKLLNQAVMAVSYTYLYYCLRLFLLLALVFR